MLKINKKIIVTFLSLIVMALSTVTWLFADDDLELWIIIGATLLLIVLIILITLLPEYSVRKWWGWSLLYNTQIIGKYDCKMTWTTIVNKEVSKGSKAVLWEIRADKKDLILIQKTNQAESTATLFKVIKTKKGNIEFWFNYNVDSLKPNNAKVPMHDGVLKVVTNNETITSAEYLNKKPGFGYYTNINKRGIN